MVIEDVSLKHELNDDEVAVLKDIPGLNFKAIPRGGNRQLTDGGHGKAKK